MPTRYYLELRLARARQLLLQTSMSIVDVAFASGFVLRRTLVNAIAITTVFRHATSGGYADQRLKKMGLELHYQDIRIH